MQVERIDVLLAVLVDPAEGVEDDERVVLGEDLFLDLALSYTHCLLGNDQGNELLGRRSQYHSLFKFWCLMRSVRYQQNIILYN